LNDSRLHSRLSAKILWFALLAVVAVAPFRSAAQESAPAANSQAAAAPETPKPEAAKSEEEDNNIYRHTALVEAAGKALHLPVETTARIFEFINFAIIALAIGIPLAKFLPKFIRKRSATLKLDIESARKATGDANARLSAIEAKLSGLDEEIAQIRAQVEQESQQDQARIQTSLKDESERIVASAEQEIAVAAAQARRGLRHFAADLAIEQAGKQLVLTPEADRALIAEFSAELAKGGQN
jgi:F-type H+-transporting ATPase subunit b